jgi:hypothetical protein
MDINPIILAIPIYFILIGVEVLYDRLNHKKRYRLNDAITNISCGITEQATGVFVKVFTLAVYHFIFVNFAIFSVPETVFWTVVSISFGSGTLSITKARITIFLSH